MQAKPKRFKHKIPNGIASVVEDKSLIGSPACVSPSTRIMRINPDVFYALPHDTQKMIIGHEAGHIVLGHTEPGIMAEIEADAYASEQYFAGGGSPRKSVKALTRVLPMSNDEHDLRAWAQLYRAAKHDWEENNNPNAKQILDQMDPVFLNEDLDHFEDHYYSGSEDDEFSFLGMGKKAKQRREEKRSAKQEKRNLRNENKRSKISARDARARAKELLAAQGIKSGSGETLEKVIGAVSGVAGKYLGGMTGGGMGTADSPTDEDPTDTGGSGDGNGGGDGDNNKKDDKKILGMEPTTFYIVLGVVVVIVIVVVILVMKNKKP